MTRGATFTLAMAALVAPPRGDREPAAILRDYDAVSYPSFSDGADPESIARFQKAIDDAAKRQEELALELLAAAPSHPRLADVMERRWALLTNVGGETARVLEETERLVAPDEARSNSRSAPDVSPGLRHAAFAARAHAAVEARDLEFAKRRELVDAALAASPKEASVAESCFQLVTRHSADPKVQRDALARLVRDFGETDVLGRDLKRFARLLDRVGTKVELGAVDSHRELASSGTPRVLVSFPSPDATLEREELAAAKELHARFAERGVELVVVHALFAGDTEEARRARIAKLGLPGRHLFERWSLENPGLAARLFDVNSSSFAALFDAEDRLVAVTLRLAAIAPQVESLLDSTTAKPPRKRSI